MLALSIRQPFAELILRGIKTVEYRTKPTRIIGQRFFIYASRSQLPVASCQWPVKTADNIGPPGGFPEWMIELAEQIKMIEPDFDKLSRAVAMLPRGVIVGSASVARCELLVAGGTLHVARGSDQHATSNTQHATYAWHLTNVERIKRLRKPRNHPQPVWFRPFD